MGRAWDSQSQGNGFECHAEWFLFKILGLPDGTSGKDSTC